ncbi:MAG: hypothetical protein E7137_05660 [Rikenellaceae bacterium]|nr:hypothetical protein [Rikenellaceae bacterium]
MKNLSITLLLLLSCAMWAEAQEQPQKSELSSEEREAAHRLWFENFEARFEKGNYPHKGVDLPYRTLHIAPEKSGKAALVIFLHSSKGRGIDNRGQLRGSVQQVVKNLEQIGQKVLLAVPQCRPDRRWNENYATLGDKMPIVLRGWIDQLLADHPEVDPARLYLIGDSSGGSGVLFMLDNYPKLFAGAIAASCYPHKSNSAAAIAKTPLAISYSDYQPEREALTRKFADKIAKNGGTVRYTPISGYDNNYSRLSVELIEWMLSFRRK